MADQSEPMDVEETVIEGEKKKIDKGTLAKAIKEVLYEKKAIRKTALLYNIPKSNLIRYVARFKQKVTDTSAISEDADAFNKVVHSISSIFSVKLVSHIMHMARQQFRQIIKHRENYCDYSGFLRRARRSTC